MRSALVITSLMLAIVASEARAQSRPATAASCDVSRASGVSMQQLMSGQRQRGYRLFVPPGYDGHTRLPLVLDLHGSGGSSTGQARTSGFETLAGGERFLVATLDAEGARWNVPVQDSRPDDVAYVADVIAHVGTLVCTDDTRVYATGFSGGARMTSLLGCRLGSRLAAIAPVSGLRFSEPCSGKPVPVPHVPRPGRSAEPVRRPRDRSWCGVGGKRARCARWMGTAQLLPERGRARRSARPAVVAALQGMRERCRGRHRSHRRPWSHLDEEGNRHDPADLGVLQESPARSLRTSGMHLRPSPFCFALVTAASLLMWLPRVDAQTPPRCDRTCLERTLDGYVDALVARQPARLTLAPSVKFTENGQRLELGDGLWRTVTGRGRYALTIADVETAQAVRMGTIREADVATIVVIRVKVTAERIAEVETLVIRNQMAAESLDSIGAPRSIWTQTLPAGERTPRADVVRIANMYFSGIERNDGRGTYPIADSCARLENGVVTAGDPTTVIPAARPAAPDRPRSAAARSSRPGCSSTSPGSAIADSWSSIRSAASRLRLRSSTTARATPATARYAMARRSCLDRPFRGRGRSPRSSGSSGV